MRRNWKNWETRKLFNKLNPWRKLNSFLIHKIWDRFRNFSKNKILPELFEHLFSFQEPPVLRLRLDKPKNDKKVQWRTDTVDNEHLNRKKSKCCCIYVKPKQFGESSSESEDECEHCFGHVELKKKRKGGGGGDDGDAGPSHDVGKDEGKSDEKPAPTQWLCVNFIVIYLYNRPNCV